jgi:hypothetical protein
MARRWVFEGFTTMTARRRLEPSLDPLAAELLALRAASAEQARAIVELREDVAELRARVPPADTGPPADLVPIKQAAGLVGFDRESVRRWAIAGEIDSVRRGAAWFIDIASLRRRAGR